VLVQGRPKLKSEGTIEVYWLSQLDYSQLRFPVLEGSLLSRNKGRDV
jgi:hypothetical protein